jgi:serine/threonine protein kinase
MGKLMEGLVNNESQVAPFELLEAVEIMLQVAEGMNYLHQNNVVHRDFKSNNILVKYNERDKHVYAKVANFGLSRIKELSCTYSNWVQLDGWCRNCFVIQRIIMLVQVHQVSPIYP